MASASTCACLLLPVTIFTFLFLNYQLMSAVWCAHERSSSKPFLSCRRPGKVEDVKKLSGKMGTEMLTRFRVLLGTKASNLRRPRHERDDYPPAPAPAPAPSNGAAAMVSPPLFKTHVFSRSPLHHHLLHHSAPVQSLDHASKNAAKARHQRVITAAVASVGATLIILGAALILFCKRSSRTRKRSEKRMPQSIRRSKFQVTTGATNKVSFDPGPELFYLNSLATYLESDLSLKQTSQSETVFPNESSISSFHLHNEQPPKFELEKLSSLDKQNLPVDDLSSDDESFHSIGCSYSSYQSISDVSEENFGHLSANCSPFSSSYKSFSPNHKLSVPSLINSPVPTTALIQPTICLYPKISENGAYQPSSSPQIQNTRPLSSAQSSTPCAGMNISTHAQSTKCSSKLDQMASNKPSSSNGLISSLKQELVCAAKVATIEPSSLQNEKPPSSDNTSKAMQSAVRGDLLKPPLPPPPPTKPSSFSNGFISGKLPPPPPPCPPQRITNAGKDGAPLRKLKPLHWDKVRARPDRSMVWDKIRSSSFEFDEKMIETLFSYNLQNSSKSEAVNSKTPSPSKHVMEHKRLQNITILMKALNTTTQGVCDALLQGRGLTVQQLEALVRMAPTHEEKERLSKYEGNVHELDEAEKFIKAVLETPHSFARIEVMLYRETFEDEVAHLTSAFQMLEEACKELRSSRLFLRLLEAVLKTGNRMNVGTVRGDARAFKLDALLKLADIKGTDGKTTLLHFVVQEMVRLEGAKAMETTTFTTTEKCNQKSTEEREDDCRAMGLNLVSGLTNELCNVKKTAGIDLDILISSVSNLSNGMAQLKSLIEELSIDSRNENFVNSMKHFMNNAGKTIKELKDNENEVLLQVREITEYYHGDISRDERNPLRIFVIVRDFLGMLDQACKEVKSLKSRQGPFPVIPFR